MEVVVWDDDFAEWQRAEPELEKLIAGEGLSGVAFYSPYPRLIKGAELSMDLRHAPFLLGKCLYWYGWRTDREGAEGMVKFLSSAASDESAVHANEGALMSVIDECYGATSRSLVGDVFRVTVNLHADVYTALVIGASYRIITSLASMEEKGTRRKFVMEASVVRVDDPHATIVMHCKSMFIAFVDQPMPWGAGASAKDTFFGRASLPPQDWVRYDISGRLVSPRTDIPTHEKELANWESSDAMHKFKAHIPLTSRRPEGAHGGGKTAFPFLYNRVLSKYYSEAIISQDEQAARSSDQVQVGVVGVVRFLGHTEGHAGEGCDVTRFRSFTDYPPESSAWG
jgi:hypothetical protein